MISKFACKWISIYVSAAKLYILVYISGKKETFFVLLTGFSYFREGNASRYLSFTTWVVAWFTCPFCTADCARTASALACRKK